MYFDKSQWVRLVDIFILGPFLMWYALQTRDDVEEGPFLALLLSGILTVIYNGINYAGNVGIRFFPVK
jgi:hypothetical protein